MTTIYSTAGQPAPQSVPGGFFRVLGSWVNGIVTYLARRQAIQTLNELDDRALRDIGIERSRIESAVRGTVDPAPGEGSALRPSGAVTSQCRTTSTEHLA
jgi:uncharacterized protein YjiS (DUF1127 family)